MATNPSHQAGAGQGMKSKADETTIEDYIKHIPKVELHAHLNGCIREATLFELAQERKVQLSQQHFAQHHQSDGHSMYNVRPRSLQDCFDMFAEIPKCVDDLVSLERITMEALEDFASHHVVYLELRSTPKKLLVKTGGSEVADKYKYCETILKCMSVFERQEEARYAQESANRSDQQAGPPRLPMACRFIVAVDRSQSEEDALEHVRLAHTLKTEFDNRVVGVDLGGNPTKNDFSDFLSAFEEARALDLKITLHCAEVDCHEDNPQTESQHAEAKAILDFKPNRLGHALLLPPSLQKQLLEAAIPVETCPTSNVMTLELATKFAGSLLEGLKTHPQLESWIREGHPLSISTDDPGVFHTNATKELLLVQRAFGLDKAALHRIVLSSIDQAFCEVASRKRLRTRVETWIENY